jgi:hypothetical protein
MATIIPFPAVAVRVQREDAAWLVTAPNGHGWIHGDRLGALRDAKWLAANFGRRIVGIDSPKRTSASPPRSCALVLAATSKKEKCKC